MHILRLSHDYRGIDGDHLSRIGIEGIAQIVSDLAAEEITIVMTTHDTGLMDVADVIYQLEDGELIE